MHAIELVDEPAVSLDGAADASHYAEEAEAAVQVPELALELSEDDFQKSEDSQLLQDEATLRCAAATSSAQEGEAAIKKVEPAHCSVSAEEQQKCEHSQLLHNEAIEGHCAEAEAAVEEPKLACELSGENEQQKRERLQKMHDEDEATQVGHLLPHAHSSIEAASMEEIDLANQLSQEAQQEMEHSKLPQDEATDGELVDKLSEEQQKSDYCWTSTVGHPLFHAMSTVGHPLLHAISTDTAASSRAADDDAAGKNAELAPELREEEQRQDEECELLHAEAMDGHLPPYAFSIGAAASSSAEEGEAAGDNPPLVHELFDGNPHESQHLQVQHSASDEREAAAGCAEEWDGKVAEAEPTHELSEDQQLLHKDNNDGQRLPHGFCKGTAATCKAEGGDVEVEVEVAQPNELSQEEQQKSRRSQLQSNEADGGHSLPCFTSTGHAASSSADEGEGATKEPDLDRELPEGEQQTSEQSELRHGEAADAHQLSPAIFTGTAASGIAEEEQAAEEVPDLGEEWRRERSQLLQNNGYSNPHASSTCAVPEIYSQAASSTAKEGHSVAEPAPTYQPPEEVQRKGGRSQLLHAQVNQRLCSGDFRWIVLEESLSNTGACCIVDAYAASTPGGRTTAAARTYRRLAEAQRRNWLQSEACLRKMREDALQLLFERRRASLVAGDSPSMAREPLPRQLQGLLEKADRLSQQGSLVGGYLALNEVELSLTNFYGFTSVVAYASVRHLLQQFCGFQVAVLSGEANQLARGRPSSWTPTFSELGQNAAVSSQERAGWAEQEACVYKLTSREQKDSRRAEWRRRIESSRRYVPQEESDQDEDPELQAKLREIVERRKKQLEEKKHKAEEKKCHMPQDGRSLELEMRETEEARHRRMWRQAQAWMKEAEDEDEKDDSAHQEMLSSRGDLQKTRAVGTGGQEESRPLENSSRRRRMDERRRQSRAAIASEDEAWTGSSSTASPQNSALQLDLTSSAHSSVMQDDILRRKMKMEERRRAQAGIGESVAELAEARSGSPSRRQRMEARRRQQQIQASVNFEVAN